MDKDTSNTEEHSPLNEAIPQTPSPLDQFIPEIPTEEIQNMVDRMFYRAASLEQSKAKQSSRQVLVEMFLELIENISRVILDALRNIVLEERTQEDPLQVSEQAVTRAVQTCLSDSLSSVLDSSHESISSIHSLLIPEVTSHVNSVLAQSKVQDMHLVVPEETVHRPPKQSMKELVCALKNKMKKGMCGGLTDTEPSTLTEVQGKAPEVEIISTPQVDQKASSGTSLKYPSSPSKVEEEKPSHASESEEEPAPLAELVTPAWERLLRVESKHSNTLPSSLPSGRSNVVPPETPSRCFPCICSVPSKEPSHGSESEEEHPRTSSSRQPTLRPPQPQIYGPALSSQSTNKDYRTTPEMLHYLQPSQAPLERVVPLESTGESPLPTPDVPKAPTSEKLDPLSELWSKDDCNALVFEVVSKIFEAEFDELGFQLSQDLLAQLEDQVSGWNVSVKPSRYEDVASAVYKDLCKGKKKAHVHHAALTQRNFSSTVLETIRNNLEVSKKPKKYTLGTFRH